MATPVQTQSTSDTSHPDRSGAALLIFLGAYFLLIQVVDLGFLTLPILGGSFLAWGILARSAGLLIPGGVLSGIGLGIYLTDGPPNLATGDAEGGVFLLSFALGWFLIWALSVLFTSDRLWWALIPAGVMATIGGAVLGGGIWLQALELVGTLWPLGLIAGGVLVLYRSSRGRA